MKGPGLVAWGGGPVAAARERLREGARIVSWPGADTGPLCAAGLPFETAESVLGPAGLAACAAAGRSWARVWARLPLCGTQSFRDLATWRGESLLWTCEAFLARVGAGARCAAAAELALRLLAALQPAEVDACGLAEHDAVLLARAATISGVLFHGPAGAARPLAVGGAAPTPARTGSLLSRLVPRRRPAPPSGARRLLVLADPAAEVPLAPLQEAANDDPQGPLVVATGDLGRVGTNETRRRAAATAAALRELHAAIAGTPALRASHAHRGVVFDDLAANDPGALLLARLPATVLALECGTDLVAAVRPELLVVAVADVDERRSYGLLARACGLPWAALRVAAAAAAEPERADGGPLPVATLTLAAGAEPGVALAALQEAALRGAGLP